jgi:hypothetical protein
MGKFIIDTQTGTMVSAEHCYVVDEHDFPDDFNDMSDRELSELASVHGARLNIIGQDTGWGDNKYRYTVSYSPLSIRDEVASLLDGYIYTEEDSEYDALQWVGTATEEQLSIISESIMSGDAAWDGFRENLIEGILWVYKNQEEK